MQPYFFPYAGHFSLIAACDEWVVFDTPQYAPRSWMNRNRVLHPAGGSAWITVALSNGSIHVRTHEARILDVSRTRRSLLGQLSHCRRAPFYRAVVALVEAVFATEDASLVALNHRALAAVCGYIGLPFRARVCSQLGIGLPDAMPAGEWAPALCAAIGASSYVNPAGGRELFQPGSFTRRGLELHLLTAAPFTYQQRGPFEPNLSILDALMWNPPERVLQAVRRYTLEQVC